MTDKPYYHAYEKRYRTVYAAGVERWGHDSHDPILVEALTNWVRDNGLAGKKIIEFACGEGGSGEILSRLGCRYHGVDIAPAAVEKAARNLTPYADATVSLLDMVREPVLDTYDAALDVMGLHMLILDEDRRAYLQNAYRCLRGGAPMLFFRESYRTNAPAQAIDTLAQWLSITGDDYETPQKRTACQCGMEIEVCIPLVPARARTKDGYLQEMRAAGFAAESFVEMDINMQCPYSASIYVRKPEEHV